MSTPPPPPPSPPPPDDGFPKPGEGTETISYLVGCRFSGGPVGGDSVPGHLLGEFVARLSKLYSALRDRGSNLSRAVDNHPFGYRGTVFAASIDVFLDAPGEVLDAASLDDEFDALKALTGAARSSVAGVAAEHGGAVATAYRQLASLVGQRDVSTTFFLARDFAPVEETFVRLSSIRAAAHAEALSDRSVLRIDTVRLMGKLDELAHERGFFKLQRPVGLTARQEDAWREAVGPAQSVDGSLTDEAATDIRQFNAWSSLVEVELQVTSLTPPTSTRADEISAELLRIVAVQPELDAE